MTHEEKRLNIWFDHFWINHCKQKLIPSVIFCGLREWFAIEPTWVECISISTEEDLKKLIFYHIQKQKSESFKHGN